MARTTRKAKQPARKRTTTVNPIPRGIGTVTPYLVINGAAKAIEFYKKAFGAKEMNRSPGPGGSVMHAMIRVGDSNVMMSDEFPGSDTKSPASAGSTTVDLHIYSKDVDALWNRAVNAGATPTMPLENQFSGERYRKLRDPFGHVWSPAMGLKMSKPEKETKRQE